MFIDNLNVLNISREFPFHKMCHQIHVAETAVSEQRLGAELLLPCLCCGAQSHPVQQCYSCPYNPSPTTLLKSSSRRRRGKHILSPNLASYSPTSIVSRYRHHFWDDLQLVKLSVTILASKLKYSIVGLLPSVNIVLVRGCCAEADKKVAPPKPSPSLF